MLHSPIPCLAHIVNTSSVGTSIDAFDHCLDLISGVGENLCELLYGKVCREVIGGVSSDEITSGRCEPSFGFVFHFIIYRHCVGVVLGLHPLSSMLKSDNLDILFNTSTFSQILSKLVVRRAS
ncbi:hypothetical protein D1647_10250 [Alistipes sp. Z76]|nr:hypothetical protein [Alistipes sp. Z76]